MFNGLNVTLSCEATGSVPIRYQWRRVNGEISTDRAKGVNTSTLTISPVTEQDEDNYYCVASNGGMDGLLYSNESQKSSVIVYGKLFYTSYLPIYISYFASNIEEELVKSLHIAIATYNIAL